MQLGLLYFITRPRPAGLACSLAPAEAPGVLFSAPECAQNQRVPLGSSASTVVAPGDDTGHTRIDGPSMNS